MNRLFTIDSVGEGGRLLTFDTLAESEVHCVGVFWPASRFVVDRIVIHRESASGGEGHEVGSDWRSDRSQSLNSE